MTPTRTAGALIGRMFEAGAHNGSSSNAIRYLRPQRRAVFALSEWAFPGQVQHPSTTEPRPLSCLWAIRPSGGGGGLFLESGGGPRPPPLAGGHTPEGAPPPPPPPPARPPA